MTAAKQCNDIKNIVITIVILKESSTEESPLERKNLQVGRANGDSSLRSESYVA